MKRILKALAFLGRTVPVAIMLLYILIPLQNPLLQTEVCSSLWTAG